MNFRQFDDPEPGLVAKKKSWLFAGVIQDVAIGKEHTMVLLLTPDYIATTGDPQWVDSVDIFNATRDEIEKCTRVSIESVKIKLREYDEFARLTQN